MNDIEHAEDPAPREPLHLLGVHEIAELMFRIARGGVVSLTCRDDFPAPIAELAQGAVWADTDVLTWLDQHADALAELLKNAQSWEGAPADQTGQL